MLPNPLSKRVHNYTTTVEFGPKNSNEDGLLRANSIVVVHMDPLGIQTFSKAWRAFQSRGLFYPTVNPNVRALASRIGLRGKLDYSHDKETTIMV